MLAQTTNDDDYRYGLPLMRTTLQTPSDRVAVFIMFNPGSKKAENDHTGRHVTRDNCAKLAASRGWDCGLFTSVNLFARRAGGHRELKRLVRMHGIDPVGNPPSKNDAAILEAAKLAAQPGNLLVCAWGGLSRFPVGYKNRHREVMDIVRQTAVQPKIFGRLNDDGTPRHPLHPLDDWTLHDYELKGAF